MIKVCFLINKNHLLRSFIFVVPHILYARLQSNGSCLLQEIPIKNPVYLMLGASFGSAAKGTGLKALEFALSMCDSVDMYGFTVDPGYKEWYYIICWKLVLQVKYFFLWNVIT